MAAGDARLHNVRALVMGDSAGTIRHVGCNADGMLYTFPWANFAVQQDLTLNDSDKTFTVPTGHLWVVHWIYISLTTSATVGSREPSVSIIDPAANIIGRIASSGVVPASTLTFIQLAGAIGFLSDSSQQVIGHSMPGPLLLPAAWQLNVLDFGAVDPTADDMLVSIGRQEIELF